MSNNKSLSQAETSELLALLKIRFEQNMNRHTGVEWTDVEARLINNLSRLWSLKQMEATGGEPDVTAYDSETGRYLFCDCSPESPAGRRSLCYDQQSLDSRKANKPAHSAMGLASEMGVELLSEEQYHQLQQSGPYDTKSSSWLHTPENIRIRGGAIFGDCRYGRVFIYHNGAESYYAVRGFRGMLWV